MVICLETNGQNKHTGTLYNRLRCQAVQEKSNNGCYKGGTHYKKWQDTSVKALRHTV
jgi:hypothetical protein